MTKALDPLSLPHSLLAVRGEILSDQDWPEAIYLLLLITDGSIAPRAGLWKISKIPSKM